MPAVNRARVANQVLLLLITQNPGERPCMVLLSSIGADMHDTVRHQEIKKQKFSIGLIMDDCLLTPIVSLQEEVPPASRKSYSPIRHKRE